MNTVHAERRHFLRATLAGACAGAVAGACAAEGKVYFGYVPDSLVTPMLGALMKELQGCYQPDLGSRINYMPGNSAGFAVEAAGKGEADGSCALIVPSTILTLAPYLRKLPTIDGATAFAPAGGLGEFTLVLALGPSVPAEVKTLPAYLRWVRDNPTEPNYGVLGLGTASHFLGMSIAQRSETPLKPVAYKSNISMKEDLKYGKLPAAFMTTGSAAEAAAEGMVRLVAVASEQRWPGLPEVPTFRELDLSDAVVLLSYGLFLPARTPAAKVRELGQAVDQACAAPALRAGLQYARVRPMRQPAAGYAAAIDEERKTWGEVLKRNRFNIES